MADETAMEEELNKKYEHLRNDYRQEHPQLVPLDEARRQKPDLWH